MKGELSESGRKRGRPPKPSSLIAKDLKQTWPGFQTDRQSQNRYFAINAWGAIIKADIPGKDLLGVHGPHDNPKKISVLTELGRFDDDEVIVQVARCVAADLLSREVQPSVVYLRRLIRKYRLSIMDSGNSYQ